ncbi:MAG: hypothetical protein WCE50_04460 [Candidatus Acidiferrum sp.]
MNSFRHTVLAVRRFNSELGGKSATFEIAPMKYSIGGNQIVAIAAGGHGTLGTMQGDSVAAFALP